MVDEEVVLKKKKKVKKRPSEGGEVDPTPLKKKKAKLNAGESAKKKKKKKKKLLKNSTMLHDQSQTAEQLEDEADQDDANSENELFGSQSPIASSDVPILSPPPLSRHAPLDNGMEEEQNGTPGPKSPVKTTPIKKSTMKNHPVNKKAERPSPTIVFKKKDSQSKPDPMLGSESDDALSIEEEAPVSPAPGEDALSNFPPSAPLSDPLLSQHDQDQRDLLLLHQVSEKFPENTRNQDINWNEIICFNMSPDEMSARFEVLISNIPREKNFRTLVNEAKIAFCNTKLREIPASKRDVPAKMKLQNDVGKKRINAFSLFSTQFDARIYNKSEIKSKWDTIDAAEKKKLMKEARALNNIHRIQRGEAKVKRPLSGYMMFTKEQINEGRKMAELGPIWKNLTQEEKDKYKVLADEANSNRERTPSSNEPSSQS